MRSTTNLCACTFIQMNVSNVRKIHTKTYACTHTHTLAHTRTHSNAHSLLTTDDVITRGTTTFRTQVSIGRTAQQAKAWLSFLCCSVWQWFLAVYGSVWSCCCTSQGMALFLVWQPVAVCCSVLLQYVAARRGVFCLWRLAHKCVAACCSVLQRVAVCCSVVQSA